MVTVKPLVRFLHRNGRKLENLFMAYCFFFIQNRLGLFCDLLSNNSLSVGCMQINHSCSRLVI